MENGNPSRERGKKLDALGFLNLEEARLMLEYCGLKKKPAVILLYAPDARGDYQRVRAALEGLHTRLSLFDVGDPNPIRLGELFEQMSTTDEIVIVTNDEFNDVGMANYLLIALAEKRRDYLPLVVKTDQSQAKIYERLISVRRNTFDVSENGWTRLPIFLMDHLLRRQKEASDRS